MLRISGRRRLQRSRVETLIPLRALVAGDLASSCVGRIAFSVDSEWTRSVQPKDGNFHDTKPILILVYVACKIKVSAVCYLQAYWHVTCARAGEAYALPQCRISARIAAVPAETRILYMIWVTDIKMKQPENSEEGHQVFVGNTDFNILVTSGSPITIKRKRGLSC
jgi:hypothetical protein